MTMNEKVLYLKRLRKKPIFDRMISRTTLREVRKRNFRVYITMSLFYHKRFRSLLCLLTYGIDIMNKLRFARR